MAAGALACGFYRFCEPLGRSASVEAFYVSPSKHFEVQRATARCQCAGIGPMCAMPTDRFFGPLQAKDSYRLMAQRAELLLSGPTREAGVGGKSHKFWNSTLDTVRLCFWKVKIWKKNCQSLGVDLSATSCSHWTGLSTQEVLAILQEASAEWERERKVTPLHLMLVFLRKMMDHDLHMAWVFHVYVGLEQSELYFIYIYILYIYTIYDVVLFDIASMLYFAWFGLDTCNTQSWRLLGPK